MDKIFPILLGLFVVVAGASHQFLRYRMRVLVHKERLLAMEKSIDLPADPAQAPSLAPQVCLLRGLLWLSIGIACTICLLAIAALLKGDDRTAATAWAMAGLIPTGIGCAYLLYYRLERKK
jgi:hypothetical protein